MSAAEATTVVRLRPVVAVVVAVGALAAATGSMLLALASDHVSLPAFQSGLFIWISVSYVLCGLVAWRRRPESRFGPLMIAAGFGTALSNLAWANDPVVAGIGLAFDLLPLALFLHVFLAFPDGRLTGPVERGHRRGRLRASRSSASPSPGSSARSARRTCSPSCVLPTFGEALYGGDAGRDQRPVRSPRSGSCGPTAQPRRPRRRAGALHRRRVRAGPA